MSIRPIFVAVCPFCGYDVARAVAAESGWRVVCDPECSGCGAQTAVRPTEGEAVTSWNRRPSPGAIALREAAKRRAAVELCPDCGRIDGGHWSRCPSDDRRRA